MTFTENSSQQNRLSSTRRTHTQMLRTTKKLALLLFMIAAMANIAHAAPTKNVRKVTPAPNSAAALYVQKVNAFIKDSRWKPGTTYNSSQKPKLSKYKCTAK